MAPPTDIPGTTIFGPAEARKGLVLQNEPPGAPARLLRTA
jgi:hypothetical protein